MEFKDYYQILGVERDAADADIKKAYRKLARKYHPDVSKEPDAEVHMKAINEAFAVLSDPEKRSAYDDIGKRFNDAQDFTPPPDWNAGHEFSGAGTMYGETPDFSDFFSELFGSRTGNDRPGTAHRGRGSDHHGKILLDLEDAYHGASRTLSIRVPQIDERGRMTLGDRTLEVRIPKGVQEGQLIRLPGQGSPSLDGGQAGDLYLEVQFKPHKRYRVEKRDVYATLPVAPWEAALGAKVKAPVPDGALEVSIPAASQTGRKLRLQGRGIPGTPAGDLYLVLEVVLPPPTSDRARDIYRMMEKGLAFDPRQGLGER